jgi:predicted metal-dependent phosphoesterase TrpH
MLATLENLYAQKPNKKYRWLKGNLHAHTTLSDGSRAPQVVVDLYKCLGHDFMALTDHDVWSNYSKLDSRGMVFLMGNEVTAFGPHVLQVGSSAKADPLDDRQAVIDAIVKTGGLAVLNHPNWESDWDHYPMELMEKLKGYHGTEIYNGV